MRMNKAFFSLLLRRLCRPLPVAAFVTTVGVVEYRRINYGESQAKPWEITCYSSIPLRVMSRGWGWICQKELPVNLRSTIYSRYAQMFGVNIEEAASQDFSSYPSLCDFFCRALQDGVRPLDNSEMVSPADGAVLNIGKIVTAKVEQVKGVTYSLEAFFGESVWNDDTRNKVDSKDQSKNSKDAFISLLLKNKENELYQCVVYLAPGDYHRFHSPVDWTIHFRRHIQGELLSVNPKIARFIPDLFSLNERAVYIGKWKYGFFSLTAVGATNVGSIHMYSDQSLKTNQRKWQRQPVNRDKFFGGAEGEPLHIKKGDPFGEFRLGSTIVLIFEAPKDFQFCITSGQKVQFGKSLCLSERS